MTLAEDLVTAAAQAICQTYDKSVTTASQPVIHATTPEEWTPEARAVVVAVLDKLAGAGLTMFRYGGFGDRVEIGELATEVESGVPQAEKPQP